MKLHRQLGISYNAAWRMRHKLMQVMHGALTAPHPLGGFSTNFDDAYLARRAQRGQARARRAGQDPFQSCAVETNAEGHPLRSDRSFRTGTSE